MEIVRISPNNHTVNARYHPLLPRGSEVEEALFSPLGDRIVWKLCVKRANPWLTFLHKWLPGKSPKVSSRIQLWISRFDGTGMRELGFLETDKEPYGLRWTLDGKGVSFVYQDQLWLARVP